MRESRRPPACSSRSQAVTLIKAYKAHIGPYLERPALIKVWGEIIATTAATKITAATIQRAIDPNWEHRQTAKLSKPLVDRARRIAAGKGMSLDEYLSDLMDSDEGLDEAPSDEVFDEELTQVLDNLDRKFARLDPIATADRILDSIDAMFGGIFRKPDYGGMNDRAKKTTARTVDTHSVNVQSVG